MPVRTEASPIPIAISIVERMLHAMRAAAMTGRTISAAISRMPTTRIESAIVTAASAAVSALRAATGSPATRAPSSSTTTATSGAVEQRDQRERGGAERRDHDEVGARHRQDRAEQELEEVDVERARGRHEHDAARDPRVEDERERLVARRPAPGAQSLDRERAGDGDDERRQHERQVEQVADRDAGEGDVADPVADQAQPALHEEEADGRREQSDDDARAEREPHELEVKHGRATGRARHRAGPKEARRRRCARARARSVPRSARPRRTRARRTGSSCRARVPSRCSSAATASCASTSTPVVGSSSASSSGSPASAFAMNARCCWPPESVVRRAVRLRAQPDALDRIARRRRGRRGAAARAGASARRARRRPARAPSAARRSPSAHAAAEISAPLQQSTCTRPVVGCSSPRISRSSVVLPPPFGPAIATNSPRSYLEVDVSQHRHAVRVRERDVFESKR